MKHANPAHERVKEQLNRIEDDRENMKFMRFGLAMTVLTIALWGAYVSYFARQALRDTASLLKSLAFLAAAVLVYRGLTMALRALFHSVLSAIHREIRKQDNISDRIALAIVFGVALLGMYGVYRLAKWAVEPWLEKLRVSQEQMTLSDEFRSSSDDADDPNTAESSELELPDSITDDDDDDDDPIDVIR